MTIRNAIFFLLILCSGTTLLAQQEKSAKVISSYQKLWDRIEAYGNEGLPNEQVRLLDSIITISLQQRKAPEFHRALQLYPSVMSQTMLEAEDKHQKLADFETMSAKLEAPYSNILHGFLAQQFDFHESEWEIANWGQDFSVACIVDGKTVYFTKNYEDQQLIKAYHYRKSMENIDLLFKQKAADYANSLGEPTAVYLQQNPTLADVLAYRYLYFITQKDQSGFNPQFYAPTEDLLKGTSNEALKIYQALELHHWKNKQLDAYTNWILFRFNYVKRTDKNNQHGKLYIEALQLLRARLNGHASALGAVLAEIQEKLHDPANQYHWKNNSGAKEKKGELRDQLVEAMKQYPGSLYEAEAKNLLKSIESKLMQLNFVRPNETGRSNLMTVTYQNVEQAYLHIYHIDRKDESKRSKSPFSTYELSKVHGQALPLDNQGRFNRHSKDFIIPDLKHTGEYLFLITSTEDSASIVLKLEDLQKVNVAFADITINNFSTLNRYNGKESELLVLDKQTGKGISDARIYIKKDNSKSYEFLGKTSAKGEFTFQGAGFMKIVKGSDSVMRYMYAGYDQDYGQEKGYRMITDRNIYRPGQTVHFKAYVFEGQSPDYKMIAGHDVEIRMMDYNGTDEVVATGKTNEFGTFSGSFNLPRSMRMGLMYVEVNGEVVSHLMVEEYKRPSFEVEAKFDKESYKLGDKVTVNGKVKAYSGYGIAHAKLHVQIDYTVGFRYYYGGMDNNLLDTVIESDAQGVFSFSFIAKTEMEERYGASFTYNISATGGAGETQTASESVFIGRARSEWDVNIPGQVLSDNPGIAVMGLLDEPEKKPIELQIWQRNKEYKEPAYTFVQQEFQGFTPAEFKKHFPAAIYYESKAAVQEYVLLKTMYIQSGDSISLRDQVSRNAGNYQIRLNYRSEVDTITFTQDFVYINLKSKRRQHHGKLWIAVGSKTYKPGDVVAILIGSSNKKQNALVEISHGNKLLRKEWIVIKGRKTINYTVQQADLGGINVAVYAMRGGEFNYVTSWIRVPFDSKQLQVKLETVRDILRPGTQEKWVVSVSSPDGSPLSSELVAGMTDASLDMFTDNSWQMSVYEESYSNLLWNEDAQDQVYFSVRGTWDGRYGYYLGGRGRRDFGVDELEEVSVGSFMELGDVNSMTYAFSANANTVAELKTIEGVQAQVPREEPPVEKARTNFNETAFFYPQLTAKDNRFQFEFTLPDALTRWKFQALAHDKLMRFGYTASEFIAQKELMADPNEPRFFRAGDDFVFAVNLVNLTDKPQDVKATLEWFDPYTNVVIPNILGEMPAQQVQLEAKGMKTVNWALKIPKTGLDLIAYRVKAASGQFSDVEEKVIPVLSNRTQAMESVPVTVDGKGRFTYELPKLLNQTSPTQQNEKLVFEYNANPLWSAVMAIPYISDYPYDCAEQVFSKFFANRISQAIISSNPLIETVLKQQGTSNPDQFLSALSTNEDLKAIMFAETPWILEAKSEAEQKRRISQLFEANNLRQMEQLNLQKLQQMQNPDGGWSWFAGGRSNMYITQHILSGFGQLRSLSLGWEEEDLIQRALAFLESEYSKQYKELKEDQRKTFQGLSALHVQWLYTKAMLGEDASEASAYYSSCLERDWLKFPLYIQAMAGTYFKETGNEAMQKKIFTSILSKATTRKGMGTYWNENKSAWSWDRNAIETQASLIEFFKKSGADEKTLASMKLWLLNQKRGQYWESTKTTAWACYALLIDAKEVKKSTFTEKIFLGNQEISGSEAGYVRQTFSKEEIKPQMGRVIIDQGAEEPAFGSLNLVYTEEIGKLSKNASGMQIDKQVFVVRDGKETLVTPETKLILGDLLRVKLQVSSDRNLEFVHVKDLRAAGTENVETLSAYRSSGNLYYYNVNKDASTEFFLDNLPKGKYTIAYDMRVSGKGTQSTGYAIVECLYAPEFRANSAAGVIKVE